MAVNFNREPPTTSEPQSKPGKMKGRSQPEIVAAAFLLLYMVLGSPFLYQVLIVTQVALNSNLNDDAHILCPPRVPSEENTHSDED